MNEYKPDELQIVIDALPQMFFQKDTKNNILRTNRAAADAVGTTVSALVGTPTTKWFPDEAGDYYKDDQEVMKSGVPRLEIVEQFQVEGESKHWISTNKYPHFDDSNTVDGILVFIRDVTAELLAEKEREELEAQIHQSQKLESIGVLAAGVAHDFNNYLMSIVGNTELTIMQINEPNKASTHLDNILHTAQQASEVCNQLLAHAGKQKVYLEPCYLTDIVADTRESLKISISKKIELVIEPAESISAVKADPNQIKQLLFNLVTNAAEAMSERSGQIIVSIGERHYNEGELSCSALGNNNKLQPGRYCYFKVKDTGSGMSPEVIDQMYQPFFTTKLSGRGLGLATVLGTVRSHQGVINVTSEPSVGTTIELIFPITDESVTSRKTDNAAATTTQPEHTILVVDDNDSVRFLLQSMLERAEFTVITAIDGADAIEVFDKLSNDIQVVLLDLNMPGRNGVEVFEVINRLKPGIPVLFSSGYPEEIAIECLKSKGHVDFIKKPYQSSYLLERIGRLLSVSL